MLTGAAQALRRRADRQAKIAADGTALGERGSSIMTGEAATAVRIASVLSDLAAEFEAELDELNSPPEANPNEHERGNAGRDSKGLLWARGKRTRPSEGEPGRSLRRAAQQGKSVIWLDASACGPCLLESPAGSTGPERNGLPDTQHLGTAPSSRAPSARPRPRHMETRR